MQPLPTALETGSKIQPQTRPLVQKQPAERLPPPLLLPPAQTLPPARSLAEGSWASQCGALGGHWLLTRMTAQW